MEDRFSTMGGEEDKGGKMGTVPRMQRLLSRADLGVGGSVKSFLNSNTSQTRLTEFKPVEHDFNRYIELVGTAHFSSRSNIDVEVALKTGSYVAVCLELCPYRYDYLLSMCDACTRRQSCTRKCEFVAVVKSLSAETGTWLIDLTQEEIAAQLIANSTKEEAEAWKRVQDRMMQSEAYGLLLWEEGLKAEALTLFNGDLELMRMTFPTLWNVLFSTRNLIMSSRLIYIASMYMVEHGEDFKIAAFVGATHVAAMERLLKSPTDTFAMFGRAGISFTLPHFVAQD